MADTRSGHRVTLCWVARRPRAALIATTALQAGVLLVLAPKAAGRVSGHSLRIGGCQDMAAAGIELLEIQQGQLRDVAENPPDQSASRQRDSEQAGVKSSY